MGDECMFVPDGDAFQPTEWAVGPWSKDLLQGSAFGGLMVRALESGAPRPAWCWRACRSISGGPSRARPLLFERRA